MSKKSSFRRPFDMQHGRRAQALLKSASQHLDHIHSSLTNQLSSKKSFLLTCKILVLLVNTLADDEKHPIVNRDNLTIPIKMQLFQNQKTLCQFLAEFLKSSFNFKYFEEKGDTHRFCISEIKDSENVVREISKKFRFRGPFDKQHCKRTKALLKYGSQHLYRIQWSLPCQLSWKKFLLLTSKMLGLHVNTLAANEKYSVFNRDNLTIPIQIQLSKQQKTFS